MKSQNTHSEVNIFVRQKSKARSSLGLFRIILKLPNLKQRELVLNSTEILQLK